MHPAATSRGRLVATAALVLTTALLTVPGTAAAEAQPITCDDTVTGQADGYPGPRASDTYDNLFDTSWHVPGLATHIPQGTATWSNWDGEDDLILVAGYDAAGKTPSVINGIDARTGENVGHAKIEYSHVGGIAVFERQGWAYVSGPQERTVRKYSLAALKEAITSTEEGLLRPEGADQTVHGSSFLTSHGPSDTLWAGQFLDDTRSHMASYTVGDDGELEQRPGVWEVPRKTQGLVVTEDLFIYSTSHGRNNRSNIYVVRRGEGSSQLDTARLGCFRAPSMSEGLTVYGDDVYVAFESGADYYSQAPDKPDNVITELHEAPLALLDRIAPP
ncbi:hypothetical protein [Pseudonocardia lacus]|uniref:hypothetical protein n=1 Tax=Pseudonocardia lacus TaxID=2835865 RepID=UPI001BDD0851|nr:hypothetical protein [Pseudonocardia lacus]